VATEFAYRHFKKPFRRAQDSLFNEE